MQKAESHEKTLMLGKIEGGRRKGWQRKRCLLLGRKTTTNLESILKSRDITLLTKVHSQSYGFPVVTYGCESWKIKKTEHWRIDAFKLWCWRRLLRVSWIARRSNQSILKEINSEYSLEGLMMKLKLPILWPPDVKSWLNGKKPPDARKDWGQKEKGATENGMVRQYHRLNGHEFEEPLGDSEGQRNLVCYSPCSWKELDMT